ncbi:uncharacterized protein LOC130815695 [Amaranthus tricolor]|uniref:uncharacterized protein LOC130815695 n=1 Tax=Amaranthus tricolor TaxID=29722 RepID=UPI00258B591B|nr:uncharacterized protein LOC130815695 [Amaranthus tricolor]
MTGFDSRNSGSVSPMKGVKRFGVKGKLSPKFIGPFEILRRIGEVTYELALPPELDGVHNVFHVSQLRKYVYDPSHILSYEPLQVDETLSYEEKPLKILDQRVKELRNKSIPLVKLESFGGSGVCMRFVDPQVAVAWALESLQNEFV